MGLWHVLEYITKHPAVWSRIHLKELTDFQLFKNSSTIYGTRKCITMFTKARHLLLYRARWIQSVPSHPTSLKPISISSCHIHTCICRSSKRFANQNPGSISLLSYAYHVSFETHSPVEIKCQLDATDDIYCRFYCMLNMFRAILCPSSGARQY